MFINHEVYQSKCRDVFILYYIYILFIQVSMMKFFSKIVNYYKWLTIFAKTLNHRF